MTDPKTILFEDGADYLRAEASDGEVAVSTQGRIPNEYELTQDELHELVEFLQGVSDAE